jgi:hypothetical protein
MRLKLGDLDISEQWRDLRSAHQLAFRSKVPSVWPRDIAFRAFTGNAQDKGFNIDFPCIEVNVTKYIDSCPVRSQVSLEHQLVTSLAASRPTTYLGHDVLRAPIVTFFLGVVTWLSRKKVRWKLLDISQDLSSQRYSGISPAEKAWMVGPVVKALDHGVPNKAVSFLRSRLIAYSRLPVKCITCSSRWIIPFSFSTVVKRGTIAGTSELPPTTITTLTD